MAIVVLPPDRADRLIRLAGAAGEPLWVIGEVQDGLGVKLS